VVGYIVAERRARMLRAIAAVTDEGGKVRLLEAVQLPAGQRVLVVIDEEAAPVRHEAALLSERALAADWDRAEEDEAWAHWQQAR
jgi:hypothetical protein